MAGGIEGTVSEVNMFRKVDEGSTDLVTGITSQASQSTLNSTSGRVNVRLEGGGLVVRHFG